MEKMTSRTLYNLPLYIHGIHLTSYNISSVYQVVILQGLIRIYLQYTHHILLFLQVLFCHIQVILMISIYLLILPIP